ncbi:hypothetical protein B0H13DRAFT_2350456 [Mycena leptocephala]|nr:hypothetical protein B0H13DRAFT_2350456 [Mycena leptocephala]
MAQQFIDCPTPTCPERIPAVLICSGQRVPYHIGFEYQVCSTCKYFKWLEPGEVEAAERHWRGAPANGSSPFPPPEGPNDPWSRSPQIPPDVRSLSPQIPHWIDPVLAYPMPPAPSQPRPSISQASQPVLSSQSSSKPGCSVGTCKRRAGSKDCSYGMCKACCELQRKGCRYPGHRTQLATASSSSTVGSDPSALSRPAPMFPLATPQVVDLIATSSASDGPVDGLPPKIYKKAMDAEWVVRYNANHEQREARKAAEEQRRQQQLMYDRQVRFYCWTEDGEEPESVRLQGITTFPKVNMADYPKLLKTFGLAATEEIWIYDPDGRSFIHEDVNHVMEVSAHQVILARLKGVKNCPCIDEYIEMHCKKRLVTGASRRALPSTSLKRKFPSDSPGFPPSLKTSQPLLLPRPSTPPSPSSSSSSPALHTSPPSSPSPFSFPTLPISHHLSPDLVPPTPLPHAAASNPDLLWKEGKVLVPSGFGAWPDGIYARDMARAFSFINSKSKPNTSLPERLQSVFATSKFTKQTWYQQCNAWKACNQEERDAAADLPRTHEGLWTTWRMTTSGWAKVMQDKKH